MDLSAQPDTPEPVTRPGVARPDMAMTRMRWRTAGESLFPSLMADPALYAGAVEAIGALAAEFGRTGAQLDDLVTAFTDPGPVLDAAAVQVPPGASPALLVGVACGMRERDLISEQVRRDRDDAIERASAAGSAWAVLNGPERIEDLTGGGAGGPAGCTHRHLSSGTELWASVDAWSPEPFRIDVLAPGTAPAGRSFTERAPWLAEFHRCRAEIEAPPARPLQDEP